MIRVKALFLSFILPIVVLAQASDSHSLPTSDDPYIVERYNSENGLPQNSAKDLLLDRNHFLWISTENGLVRFDGHHFRVYNSSNTPFLKTNRFSIISETKEREVLFTSGYDPSVVYRAMTDYRLKVDSGITHLSHKLICYHSNGVFDETSLVERYAKGDTFAISPGALEQILQPSSFWILNSREAIVRNQDEWHYLNNDSVKVARMLVASGPKEILQAFFSGRVFGILRSKGGMLFFRAGRPVNIAFDTAAADFIRSASRLTYPGLLLYTKGDLVIGKVGKDIYQLRIDHDTLKARLLFRGLPFLEDQPSYSFQYDSSAGRLFVGTPNEGLFVVTARRFQSLLFGVTGRNNNVMMAAQLLNDADILTNSGILKTNGAGSGTLFSEEDKIDRACIYKDERGWIWCSRNKNLVVYDKPFSHKVMDFSLVLDSYITQICKGSDGALWISTLSSLYRWSDGKLTTVLDHYANFVRENIETMTELFPGMLWIGTRNGIYTYRMKEEQLDINPVLTGADVRTIFQAKDKSVWIGTYGNGYFTYRDGRFIALPLDPQKYLLTVHSFSEDNKGFFWMPTNHGLFRVREKDLDSVAAGKGNGVYFDYFEKSSGFRTNEFNGGCNPASLWDKEGNLYLPSLNGIVRFHPDDMAYELPDRSIFIDGFMVDTAWLDARKAIQIRPDFNRAEVYISTPYFGEAANLRLEYQLEPISEKWYPVEEDNRITINRLPYGKYTLRIRKPEGWGQKDTYVNLAFEVLPHWYNTRLFTFLVVICFICLVFLIFWLRTRILWRQNLRLQTKVEERTRELEESTVMKEKMLSVIMHDLRSPLFSLSLLIGHLGEHYKEMDGKDIDEVLGQLEDSSKELCQFSTDFLTWYNSQKDGFSVRRERIDLDVFVRETADFYKDMADRKGLSIVYDSLPGLEVISDRNILAVVIRNILDNAVKYTRSGSIHVQAEKQDRNVLIRVRDTGQGMTAAKVEDLLSYTGKEQGKATSTFGYRFITELTEKLDGQLNIQSEPGKGTTVSVLLRA